MRWGKWIVRKAFESILPEEIVWRVKTPIECGSGTSMLPDFFNEKISDEEFKDKKHEYLNKDKVMIRNKEQLFYYEVYKSAVGVSRSTDLKGKLCPMCNSNVIERATYCRTCGAYPI
jgi:asparagine synthase (glutamine-hydrolysing)